MEKEQRKTILVVDDTELIRSFMKSLLETYELCIEFAVNGQDAIRQWEKGDFEMILMDIEMPVMGGLEAARIIRRREKEEQRDYTPIIGISGTTMAEPRQACCLAGMDAFLPKPINIRDVLDVINTYI